MTLKNGLKVKRYHHATFSHALITCRSGRRSTIAGNSTLLPSDVIDFARLPAQRLLTGNIFIVRCHVTLSNQCEQALLGKNSSYITMLFIVILVSAPLLLKRKPPEYIDRPYD